MNVLTIMCCLLSLSSGSAIVRGSCYYDITGACAGISDWRLRGCKVSNFSVDHLNDELNEYAITLLKSSLEYLSLSKAFGSIEGSRPGFQRFFRELSDEKWRDAIQLMNYTAMRGGTVDLRGGKRNNPTKDDKKFMSDLDELSSLSRALDIERGLLKAVGNLIEMAQQPDSYDPDFIYYAKKNIITSKSDNLRFLSGSLHNLHAMTTDSWQRSVGLYIFDDHLNKENSVM